MTNCPKCGHLEHKSRMHQDICTTYMESLRAECGCSYPQDAADHRLDELIAAAEEADEEFRSWPNQKFPGTLRMSMLKLRATLAAYREAPHA